MPSNDQPEFLREVSRSGDDSRAKMEPSGGATHNTSPQGWVQERARVAVGRGVNVAGKLIFQQPVRIEGYFKGEVNSADLVVIAEGGTVEGRVKARSLMVLGELRGDVVGSSRVYLGPRSRVHGEINTDNLTVTEGAYLDGSVRMTRTPGEKTV